MGRHLTWVIGWSATIRSGNCAFVTRNVEILRWWSSLTSVLISGYIIGSPTNDSAQCLGVIPSTRRSDFTPKAQLHYQCQKADTIKYFGLQQNIGLATATNDPPHCPIKNQSLNWNWKPSGSDTMCSLYIIILQSYWLWCPLKAGKLQALSMLFHVVTNCRPYTILNHGHIKLSVSGQNAQFWQNWFTWHSFHLFDHFNMLVQSCIDNIQWVIHLPPPRFPNRICVMAPAKHTLICTG